MRATRRIVVGNGNCSGKFAVGIAYDLNHANNLDAFVGFPCSVGQLCQIITRKIRLVECRSHNVKQSMYHETKNKNLCYGPCDVIVYR